MIKIFQRNQKKKRWFYFTKTKKVLYLHPPKQPMLLAQAGSPYCRAGPHLSNRIYSGEMAEWSNALVLKTSEGHTSGGSNPSFSAKGNPQRKLWVSYFQTRQKLAFESDLEIETHKR